MSFSREIKKISKKITSNKKVLFRYTEELNINIDEKSILDNHHNKIYLSYNENYYLGINRALSFTLNTKDELLELINTCSLKDYKIISSKSKEVIKFFGGTSFNMDRNSSYPWTKDIPKSIFYIPEILIFKKGLNIKATFTYIIKNDTDITLSIKKYNNFKNQLSFRTPDKTPSIIQNEILPSKNKYLEIFNKYIDEINNKKIDKIVLSRMKTLILNNTISKNDLFNNFDNNCTNFLIDLNQENTFIGSTPEQLIELNNNRIYSEAIAGTEKKEAITNLKNNKKELHEHQFVVNHIADALEPYTKSLSIKEKPSIKSLNYIQHLYTPIYGELNKKTHVIELLYKLYPTSAVLGFPKRYVLNQIKNNEPFDRGWYSGCIGWFDINGNGRFDVSIRSALINKNNIHLFSGGGIVKGSNQDKEWDETELKFQHLISSLSKQLK